MKIEKPLLKDDVSIQIVENDPHLVCGNCLKSSPAEDRGLGEKKTVWCCLNPDSKEYFAKHFCTQGLWLIEGQVMEFKEAFTYLYNKKQNEKGNYVPFYPER